MSSAGVSGLCLSRPPGRPCSWPPPHPALCTGEKANEVMSPRPAKLQGECSQPNKGFIGFVKFASGGQGPPGTRQLHRGKKEKQTMKLKGISFPEPRLTRTIQERISPRVFPSLLPRPWPLSVVQCWPGHNSHGDTGFLGSHLGHLTQKSRTWKGFWGRRGTQEVSERSFSPGPCLRARSELAYLDCSREAPPLLAHSRLQVNTTF